MNFAWAIFRQFWCSLFKLIGALITLVVAPAKPLPDPFLAWVTRRQLKQSYFQRIVSNTMPKQIFYLLSMHYNYCSPLVVARVPSSPHKMSQNTDTFCAFAKNLFNSVC